MIKNIIIGVLALVSVFFVTYANIKANEAERQNLRARLIMEQAEEKAKRMEQKAAEQAALATIEAQNARDLERQLANCK